MNYLLELAANGEVFHKRRVPTVGQAKAAVVDAERVGYREVTATVVDDAGNVVAYRNEYGEWSGLDA